VLSSPPGYPRLVVSCVPPCFTPPQISFLSSFFSFRLPPTPCVCCSHTPPPWNCPFWATLYNLVFNTLAYLLFHFLELNRIFRGLYFSSRGGNLFCSPFLFPMIYPKDPHFFPCTLKGLIVHTPTPPPPTWLRTGENFLFHLLYKGINLGMKSSL